MLYFCLKAYYPAKKLVRYINMIASEKEIKGLKKKNWYGLNNLAFQISRLLMIQLNSEKFVMAIGNGNFDVQFKEVDQHDKLGVSLLKMKEQLMQNFHEQQKNAMINEQLRLLEAILQEKSSKEEMENDIIALLTKSFGGGLVGILYEIDDDSPDEVFIRSVGCHGVSALYVRDRKFTMGEGLVGEACLKRSMINLNNVVKEYMKVESGLGQSSISSIAIIPLMFKDGLYGAIEIGAFKPFDEQYLNWLNKASESIAAHFFNNKINRKAQKQLHDLAEKQASELEEIYKLQQETYQKLEQKLKEVEDEKLKNEAILEGCVDAVICFKSTGIITFFNHSAEEIFGYTKHQVLGNNIDRYIQINLRGELNPEYISGYGAKEIQVRTEANILNGSGEELSVLITSTKVKVQNELFFTFFIQKISVELF